MKKISFSLKGFTQNELASHLFIFLAYFIVLSLLRFKLDINLIWLWVGGLIGTYLLDVDHLIYWFVSHPEEEDSKQAVGIIKSFGGGVGGEGGRETGREKSFSLLKKTVVDLYQLGQESHYTDNHLIFHTITFQVILLILTVYVLSSSGSYFGAGMVLAMNLHLLKDCWQDYLVRGKEVMAEWFLWQVRGWGVERYLKEYLVLVSLVFGLISGLFV